MTGPTAVPESEPAVPAQSLLQRGDIRALLFGLFNVLIAFWAIKLFGRSQDVACLDPGGGSGHAE